MKVKKIASLMVFIFILLNTSHHCSTWKGEELEKSILSLNGGSRVEKRDIKAIMRYQRNFIDNFDTIMDELKKIFKNRCLKSGRGPNWFYNSISDDQISVLRGLAKKLNASSDGFEFPDTADFWNKYAKLRSLSNIYPSCRLKDLVKCVHVNKHHIIPYCIGGTGGAVNCIELLEDEHKELHRIINKIIRNGE